MESLPNRPAAAELEAGLRFGAARDVLSDALTGSYWLDAMVMSELARLVDAGARWLAVAAAERQ